MKFILTLQLQLAAILCFTTSNTVKGFYVSTWRRKNARQSRIFQFYVDSDPSDYDSGSIEDGEKSLQVDTNEDDIEIRDDLKRELILLSSVTNRGEYATLDEQNLIIDLVAQLEALNPTKDAAYVCQGEWDLALSSTQFFRSSPFFQTLRVSLDKSVAENAFEIHDQATTAGRIGRVRQTITDDELISEVELEVGILPGIPFRIQGTVITTAALAVKSSSKWETTIEDTRVVRSNLPFINEVLDTLEMPTGSMFQTVLGDVPAVELKTFYLDQSMRITRDMDDNIFVFTRA